MASALSSSSCTCVASCNRRSSFLINSGGYSKRQQSFRFFRAGASPADNDTDCNTEECAPDKEVGTVSMGWRAEDNSKVAGTYPPRTRGYTGYVEKDTAGQTNIYSVEPPVYVAESVLSSGTAGTSADGAQNTAAIAAGIGVICVAAASLILYQVSKTNPPQITTPIEYPGASLSYYINKFKPELDIVEASAAIVSSTPSVDTENSKPEVETESLQEGEQSDPILSFD